ncbi:MAG: hypothetical protein KDG89_08150 [Geminicoccaceae bacterium]|nr:hypothetical protein [Geminicoccaceae bacterium]
MSRPLRLAALLLALLAPPAFAAGGPVGTWRLTDGARADMTRQFEAGLAEHYGPDERAKVDAELKARMADSKKKQPEVADRFDALYARVRAILMDPLPVFEKTVAAAFPEGGELRLMENGEAAWTGYGEGVEGAEDGAVTGSWEEEGGTLHLYPEAEVDGVPAPELEGRVEGDAMRLHANLGDDDGDTTPEGLRRAFEGVEWVLGRG